MLTAAGLLLCIIGIAYSIFQLSYAQPKLFREEMRDAMGLLGGKFDAQLTAVRVLAENAKTTLDTATDFFAKSEHRFQDIEQRYTLYEHRLNILEEQTKAISKLIDSQAKLDRRVACIERVCSRTHEHSLVAVREEMDDTDGVPEHVGCKRRRDQ